MTRFTFLLITCLSFVCLPGEAKADLVLVLDTTSQTLFFNGSATGTSAGFDSWQIGEIDFSGAFLPFEPIQFSDEVTGDFTLTSDAVSLDFFSAQEGDEVTYTALGPNSTIDYGENFNDDEVDFLESQIGNSLLLVSGTGFGDISIVSATSVPEPTSAVVLGLALGALATRRKRS